MKKLKITSLAFVLALIVVASCKPKETIEPTAEELQLDKLVSAWNNSTVTLDGTADSGDWSAFTVTFADGSYTSSGVSAGRENTVWKSNGTWKFKNAGTADVDVNTIERGDGVIMTIVVDEASLTMTFGYDETANAGRTDGITGNWVFSMTK